MHCFYHEVDKFSKKILFLEGDDSNNKCPSLSDQDNAEDEPEGETDEQELGGYKIMFSISLTSDLM